MFILSIKEFLENEILEEHSEMRDGVLLDCIDFRDELCDSPLTFYVINKDQECKVYNYAEDKGFMISSTELLISAIKDDICSVMALEDVVPLLVSRAYVNVLKTLEDTEYRIERVRYSVVN